MRLKVAATINRHLYRTKSRVPRRQFPISIALRAGIATCYHHLGAILQAASGPVDPLAPEVDHFLTGAATQVHHDWGVGFAGALGVVVLRQYEVAAAGGWRGQPTTQE